MVRFAPPTTVTGNRGATDELSVRRASELLGLDSSASGGCFTDAELEHAYVSVRLHVVVFDFERILGQRSQQLWQLQHETPSIHLP